MENPEESVDVIGLEDIEEENTAIDDLETENVNLNFIAIDQSGSMHLYIDIMEAELKSFKDAIINSKESDEILVARASFDDSISISGYKPISEFDINYKAGGMTALYDVISLGAEKLLAYKAHLKNNGMRVKAVFAVFSDGQDTCSIKNDIAAAHASLSALNGEEVVTAFISFGGGADDIAKNLGFLNILRVGGSSSELRKAFNVLSKSVIEASKSVIAKKDDFFNV